MSMVIGDLELEMNEWRYVHMNAYMKQLEFSTMRNDGRINDGSVRAKTVEFLKFNRLNWVAAFLVLWIDPILV